MLQDPHSSRKDMRGSFWGETDEHRPGQAACNVTVDQREGAVRTMLWHWSREGAARPQVWAKLPREGLKSEESHKPGTEPWSLRGQSRGQPEGQQPPVPQEPRGHRFKNKVVRVSAAGRYDENVQVSFWV